MEGQLLPSMRSTTSSFPCTLPASPPSWIVYEGQILLREYNLKVTRTQSTYCLIENRQQLEPSLEVSRENNNLVLEDKCFLAHLKDAWQKMGSCISSPMAAPELSSRATFCRKSSSSLIGMSRICRTSMPLSPEGKLVKVVSRLPQPVLAALIKPRAGVSNCGLQLWTLQPFQLPELLYGSRIVEVPKS